MENSLVVEHRGKDSILILLNKQNDSGQTCKAFCASHGINLGTLHTWKKRYRQVVQATTAPSFLQLTVPSPSSGLFAEVKGIKLYQPVTAAYLKEIRYRKRHRQPAISG